MTGNRRALRGLALLSVLGFLVILLAPTLKAWVGQKSEISAMREQVASQEREVTVLQREQARWNDDAYVEQQARQKLKFVKVGEKSYTVIDESAPDVDTARVAVSGVDPDQPWYGAVWQSMSAADAPDAQPR